MAGSTTIAMAPGQILSDVGAELFRRMLRSASPLRCSHLWMASAHDGGNGEIEIELCCNLNEHTDHWDVAIYYYSFERAIAALREYESTGNMPEGE